VRPAGRRRLHVAARRRRGVAGASGHGHRPHPRRIVGRSGRGFRPCPARLGGGARRPRRGVPRPRAADARRPLHPGRLACPLPRRRLAGGGGHVGRRSPRRRRPRPLRLHPLPSPGPAPVRRRDPQGVSRPAHLGGRARLRPRARRLARRDGPRPAGRPQPGGGVMLALTIAFRFLRSQPGQTALIIAGIGVGIAVQIFVGSLITSLQDDLVDSTVGSSAHITLLPEDDGEQISGDLAEEALRQPEVTTAIPVRRMSGLYVSGDQSTPLSITGGDPEDIDSVYGLSERIVDGEFALEDGQILVGTTFADGAATGIGDELELVLPNGEPASLRSPGSSTSERPPPTSGWPSSMPDPWAMPSGWATTNTRRSRSRSPTCSPPPKWRRGWRAPGWKWSTGRPRTKSSSAASPPSPVRR